MAGATINLSYHHFNQPAGTFISKYFLHDPMFRHCLGLASDEKNHGTKAIAP
ncbi:MAG: hypothetical protein VKK07_07705 [Merismopediaceae bacterium]|nr:hypothetical protein [Merismopediaceae bacterium]